MSNKSLPVSLLLLLMFAFVTEGCGRIDSPKAVSTSTSLPPTSSVPVESSTTSLFSGVTFNAVHMVSADEGWAVGGSTVPPDGGVAFHYTKGRWSRVELPSLNTNEMPSMQGMPLGDIKAIDIVSADEGWIAGGSIPPGGVLLHYTQGAWSANEDSPVRGVLETDEPRLWGIDMVSPDEGWAVGDSGAGTVILHYKGGKWTKVTSPTDETLFDVFMLSADEGWAVGGDPTVMGGSAKLLHYKGGKWSLVQAPTTEISLNSVSMSSADEGWAVGGFLNKAEKMLHYVDGQWLAVESPVNIALDDVQMLSEKEGWAVGWRGTILHYLEGVWQQVSSPTTATLNGIHMVSEKEGWAVGEDTILHYMDGKWSIYPGQ